MKILHLTEKNYTGTVGVSQKIHPFFWGQGLLRPVPLKGVSGAVKENFYKAFFKGRVIILTCILPLCDFLFNSFGHFENALEKGA